MYNIGSRTLSWKACAIVSFVVKRDQFEGSHHFSLLYLVLKYATQTLGNILSGTIPDKKTIGRKKRLWIKIYFDCKKCTKIRSSRCSMKKVVLKNFAIFTRKHLFFNKAAGLQVAASLN